MQSFRQIWHHTNKGQLYWMDMERVIGAAWAGDQQAIAKLYNAYSHKVLGICYSIVGNRVVAEELAHDALVLAFSKLGQLKSPNHFGAWLSSIASNVALRYKQRHHALATVPVDDMPDETWIADEPFAAKYLPMLPTEEVLRREIEQQKEIFYLRHNKKITYS